jgi:proteasome beta subunit
VTIVIALCCKNGVVMASDSQASDTAIGVRFTTAKVFKLTNRSVWGGTGDGQTITEIDAAFQQNKAKLAGAQDIAPELVNAMRPVLARRYGNVIQAPNWHQVQPATAALACGYHQGKGCWIVEVDPNCVYTHYGSRGFHAVGSAAGFALLGGALLAHFRPAEKPLDHGKLIAYRVISAAIDTSAAGVGHPIQMWYVDAAGVHEVTKDEFGVIRDSVGAWQQEEEVLLEQILGTKPPDPAPLPPPVGS